MAADLWVQVEVGLPTSKLVDRACSVLKIHDDQAIGTLVKLWIAVMEEGCHGALGDRSDRWIEVAAGWRGEPGAFAAFIREYHLDNDGVVKEWLDKYGRLEAIRAESARIKREQRKRPGRVHQTVHRTGGGTVHETVPRTPLYSSSQSLVALELEDPEQQQKPVGRENGDAVKSFVAEFEFGPFSDAVEGYIRSSKRPAAVMATLRLHAQGELGHEKATHREIGLAVQNYAANESARGFNAKYFAGHIRDAKKSVEVIDNRKRNTVEQKSIDREAEAAHLAKLEEAQGEAMLAAFKTANPQRFAELERIAGDQVPTKFTIARPTMIRASLLSLVRAEVSDAR